MAKITSWSGDSPHAREVAALDHLRAKLPSAWFGYANVFIKDPRKDAGQEVDLVLVCEDRILLIDVKDWSGKVTHSRGNWYQEFRGKQPRSMGRDPVLKLFDAQNALMSRMNMASISPRPYVMSVVLFTRKETDFSEVEVHAREYGKGRVVDLDAFLSASQKITKLDALIGKPAFESRPRKLTDKHSQLFLPLKNFFKVGRDFSVAEMNYAEYRAKGDALSKAPLWTQHEASALNSHGDVGLLRIWDFDADEGLTIEDSDRETLVSREEGVQAFLRQHKTGNNFPALSFRQKYNDGGARRWELFQNYPDNITLESFLYREKVQVPVEARMTLFESLMEAAGSLASAMVAHRDVGEHSVWIDLERHSVSLSNLVTARVPGTKSAGRNLPLLARGGVIDPNDGQPAGSAEPDPFRADVHAFAFAGLKILLGQKSHELLDDAIPGYLLSPDEKEEAGIGAMLDQWFERALNPNPGERFANCLEAHIELVAALTKDNEDPSEDALAPFRRGTPCMHDHPQHELVPPARPGVMEWRTCRDDKSATRARLWTVPENGRERQFLDFVRRGSALAVLPPAIAPKIVECSIDAYGPFFCVEEVSGERLSDCTETVAKLDDEKFSELARKLVWAILSAHDLDLAHGDLSPSNILIESWGDDDEVENEGVRLRIIDWLDFSTEEAGPRETQAYCGNELDPYLRDRQSLASILLEIGQSANLSDSSMASLKAFSGTDVTGEFPHWREISLIDIDELLAPPKQHAVRSISIRVKGMSDGEELLGEDGGFRVLFSDSSKNLASRTGSPTITVVGSGLAVVVEFDPKTRKPVNAFRKPLTVGLERVAGRKGERLETRFLNDFSVDYKSWCFVESLDGFKKFSECFEERVPDRKRPILSLPTAGRAQGEKEDCPEGATKTAEKAFLNPIKVWNATLEAEQETWHSATALAKPERVAGRGELYKIDVDFHVDLSRLEDELIIHVSDRPIGIFDKVLSQESSVVFKSTRGVPTLKENDTLEFRSKGDMSNIRRRGLALTKLALSPQIVGVSRYFAADAPSTLGSTSPTVSKFDEYGLNGPQSIALDSLWRREPIGFLQGPPGTGKTKFIAAYIHHALTSGGAKNVLLTAQTHEAVDGAAARVLDLFHERDEEIDLIRIASNADKVDPALTDYHAVAMQDRIRQKFSAERAERVAALGKTLGLNAAFVRECAKLMKGVIATSESLEALQTEYGEGNSGHVEKMRDVLLRQCSAMGVSEAASFDSQSLKNLLLRNAAEEFGVRRKDAVKLVLSLFEAASEYEEALGQRGALEPMFVRTRRLVCGTCVGLGYEKLGLMNQAFDLVVVDEAARAQGSELAIPLVSARKVLLVGDHKQLEPFFDPETLKRTATALNIDEKELEKSDFERGFESPYGRSASARLDIQYRMAPKIGEVVSDVFYGGELKTGRKEPTKKWSGLPWPFDDELSWVDVSGGEISKAGRVRNNSEVEDIVESLEKLSKSKEGQELLAVHEASHLSECFIGVIAMYADQAVALKERIATSSLDRRWREQIKVGTVDSYQGKENSIVIVSLVRGNSRGSIGFLKNENRINVALSRAKERLVIFGSVEMFGSSDSRLTEVLVHPNLSNRIKPI
ncbi:AAA domain-containing protein [Phaeobacter gallaeciensis]|uniref:AAA domain-containing protein n=1 Tax=Phaeobacter gallaeciensis TaxID=60890 RepID=UPI00237FBD4F|nr:AAA domain-containing protein [Phaeobacter gallaeciensis]MDE4061718.1 AAA domain-containing protein [Phaeobacter gallaeciensis]MDE4124738.1 AAA domain-containing protein [Phaeobacter gallaeciensis]